MLQENDRCFLAHPMLETPSEQSSHAVRMQAAQSAGILAAAVPPALSAQGTFNNADAKFDGFGPGGGVTWRRLEAMLAKAIGEQ